MPIAFDATAADTLRSAADSAARALRDQVLWRRVSAEDAMEDFQGTYAKLFTQACIIESEDRPKLAGVLEDLSIQIEVVKQKAREEKQRRKDLAAWQDREAARERERASGDMFQPLKDFGSAVFDPRPSEYPIHPAPISAAFRARSRPRSGEQSPSGGKSSADPERLQTFVGQIRASDAGMGQQLIRVKNAWARFTSACSWAPIDAATFIAGFEMLLAENAADADWLDRIAAAFERAGGGALSNAVLKASATPQLPAGFQRLLKPGLTPAEVAEAWTALELTSADVRALPLATQLRFANLDGIPASMRDTASRAVLTAARKHPAEVYQLMGFQSAGGMSLKTFTKHVTALRAAVDDADRRAQNLPGGTGNRVAQLVGFGVHDGALTAAMSLGNLDTASNVTVNVPGATTTVASAGEGIRAANELLTATNKLNPKDSYAVVSWIGYHAPHPLEVAEQSRAQSGGTKLANFIDGVYDSRGTAQPATFTIAGHSYGSTTASEALQITRHKVTSFVSYGSVGFTNGTTPKNLNARTVFATEGEADGTALIGRALTEGHRTDPREIDGVKVFSSEAGDKTKAVTGHDMYPDKKPGEIGYLSPNSTSLANIAKIIAKRKL